MLVQLQLRTEKFVNVERRESDDSSSYNEETGTLVNVAQARVYREAFVFVQG
jgi:hypothetical protein